MLKLFVFRLVLLPLAIFCTLWESIYQLFFNAFGDFHKLTIPMKIINWYFTYPIKTRV